MFLMFSGSGGRVGYAFTFRCCTHYHMRYAPSLASYFTYQMIGSFLLEYE